jgi:hypothetical protein
MRTAADPDRTLLDFLDAAYLAGARSARWNLQALARPRS